ncbi:MAG: hypothetical protein JXR83_14530, partial [Deltaproteobacteria bacterium]|nr:hypothetical protein [Deltaproteobacteria bacterium]
HALGAALRADGVASYALVIATSGPRDPALLLTALAAEAGWPVEVRTCEPRGHRVQTAARVAERLRAVVQAPLAVEPCATVEAALAAVVAAPLTLVTGSLYLVGEALAILAGEPRDPLFSGR